MKKLALIFWSMVGLSTDILYADNNFTSTNFTVNLADMDPLGSGTTPPGGVGALKSILSSVSDILLFSIPIIAAVSFIIAGYFYIASAGNSEKVNHAKSIIKWNLVAILVAFLSFAIVKIIASFFAS